MKRKILFFFLVLLLTACGITDFDMPSWDVELTSIPLMNKDFPASDLEGDNIIIEDGNLIAIIEDQLEEVTPELSAHLYASTLDIPLVASQENSFSLTIQNVQSTTTFRLVEGKLESGQMVLTYSGDYNFNTISISFEHIVNEDETPLSFILYPADFINDQYVVDFSGKKIVAQDINSDTWSTGVNVTSTANTPGDLILGEVDFLIDDNFVFEWFIGFIDTIIATDATADVEIDYPLGIENAVILDKISMYLTVYNQIGFELELMGDLVAYKNGVEVDRVLIHELEGVDLTIAAAYQVDMEAITTIEISNNERFNIMIRKMPDRFAYENPAYRINNFESEPGFISSIDQSVRSEYTIRIPFVGAFTDQIIYPDNVNEIVISEDNQELIEKRVNSATIQLEVTNGFPMGGVLDLFLSSTQLDNEALELGEAELNYLDNGIEVSGREQKYEFQLNREDLEVFLRDKLFMRTRISFYNSDGIVIILPSDNLKVKGSLNISMKVEVD